MFDLTTGLELELLLPEGTDRIELLADLAGWADARLVLFPFVSRVPVPVLDEEDLPPEVLADATVALVHQIAEHHQALLHSVTEDATAFHLIHRAGRVVDDAGATLFSVVHDNTLSGGERVAEVVTPPLLRARLPWLAQLVARLAAVPGVVVPEGGALHVHVDGRPFLDARALSRLVSAFVVLEAELRAVLETPVSFRAAGPLPPELEPALRALADRGAPWAEVRAALAEQVSDRRLGLNLYNLLGADPDKLTVELKLSRGTLDPARVVATRELFVALAERALDPEAPLPTPDTPLFTWLGLGPEHRAALRSLT